MNGLHPVVRYLVACEEVVVDPDNPHRVTLVSLISSIRSLTDPPYPLQQPELCVFVQMTECRGQGDCRLEIVQADSGQVVFRTRTRPLSFGNDPLDVFGLSFRIRNCPFPEPGLYWIQFWYNEQVIAQQPVQMR